VPIEEMAMTTRRVFLKGAAAASGMVFCGCGMLGAAHAQQPGGQRLPVMVKGKRVKTIDVHSHCHFHEAVNLMGEEARGVLPQTKGAQEHFIVIEERLKCMDAMARRFKGNGWLANTIGNPLDTTIALQHLIFEGTLDRFPGLKIIAAHGGGYLASYAPRSDHACFVSPKNCNSDIKLKKKPTEYLNQLYFDALVFTPEALRHLVAQVGASQVMLGSDHPIPWEEHPVDHVHATAALTDEEKAAILGGNAARLFGMKG
jgi:hypothetical protein